MTLDVHNSQNLKLGLYHRTHAHRLQRQRRHWDDLA
jgi:hypothetical protein